MADQKTNTYFPPVVAVLGHVDHGKTSLLDAVRKTSIADREHGGITQKIGASAIEIVHDGQKRQITFIDTPGHEAFSNMRSRGAQAADIGILVVSAVDGVMPQTRESIKLLQSAGIPLIVVFTKVDLPTAQTEKIKQQVVREGILLEGLGGDVPYLPVSAKTGQNIKELLDLILLVFDVQNDTKTEKPSPTDAFLGIVIESKLDGKAGPKATVVIKNGTVRVRETYYIDGNEVKIRTLITSDGKQVTEASIGDAVEILGFSTVPSVGSMLMSEKITKEEALIDNASLFKELSYQRKDETVKLAVILCADTQGSLEAIVASFPKDITIISQKTGEVSEADVLLAKSTGAIVLSFSTKLRPEVLKFAQTEKILVKNYTIIYELLDEVSDVLEGKRLALEEEIYGTARIIAKFPFEKTFALGIQVMDGRVARGDKLRIVRADDTVVGETTIASLRIGKNPTSKVEKGHEAGLVLTHGLDFQVGDMIICHN